MTSVVNVIDATLLLMVLVVLSVTTTSVRTIFAIVLFLYGVALVTAPEIGQVTEIVAKSPTAPATGDHEFTNAENVYDGLVALAAADVGVITTVVNVPISG